ncbi:CRISPR system Cascade subunit CasD [Spinactinospora alkalitolerans]|uniref:CRISPR system Cascade subunit CasD n=1 Tax=Spinactinospora alkalitolerans TaxID=687207 RepID=A0A852U5T5_9ACTN|nr:type I-E CRISPR-associated protein Cas5/CasD [Spinactinospora alkalitolerans]NYE50955.1 CRISPR system Cascade subunit CasD [Spinactinospora alkalitolerans]
MSGFLLRLAGPMQSWGEHSAFGERDTLPYPTRSGLVGMFASAQGVRRGESLERYEALELTVRVDSAGLRMSDFHTVGGGLPRERTVPTAEGKRRGENQTTIVTRRSYLADAVFTVAVTGVGADGIADALASPHWQPYLGRRSFVPDPLLVLRRRVADPVKELLTAVPLPYREVPEGAEKTIVDVIHEQGAGGGPARSVAVLSDVPRSFAAKRRQYATRQIGTVPTEVPAALVADRGEDYQDRIFAYAGKAEEHAGESA